MLWGTRLIRGLSSRTEWWAVSSLKIGKQRTKVLPKGVLTYKVWVDHASEKLVLHFGQKLDIEVRSTRTYITATRKNGKWPDSLASDGSACMVFRSEKSRDQEKKIASLGKGGLERVYTFVPLRTMISEAWWVVMGARNGCVGCHRSHICRVIIKAEKNKTEVRWSQIGGKKQVV